MLRHGRDAPDHLPQLHDLLRHGRAEPNHLPQLHDLLRHGRAAPDHLPQLPDLSIFKIYSNQITETINANFLENINLQVRTRVPFESMTQLTDYEP